MPRISSAQGPVHAQFSRRDLAPIVDAVEAVRWCSIWLAAINARNPGALIDAQRKLRALGITVCLTGQAARDGR